MTDDVMPLPSWTTVEMADDGRQAVTHVLLSGELDLAYAPRLVTTLDALIEDGSRSLNVDLDNVTFVDAAILGVLVHAHHRMHAAGGALVVTCRNRQPRRLLQLTGLEHLLAAPARA